MHSFHTNQIQIDGLSLNYADEGDPLAEPVLLLHGYIGSHRTWRHIIPTLSLTHCVIAPDWFGWGESERNADVPYDFETEVGRLIELIEKLEITPVNLAVHDYGGLLALGLMRRRPELVRRLAILNSRAQGTFVPFWNFYFRVIGFFGRMPGGGRLFGMLPMEAMHRNSLRREIGQGWIDPETLENYTGWMGTDPDAGRFLARFHGDYRVAQRADLVDVLGEIRCPTAIIWGDRDVYLSRRIADELGERIPGAELHVLKGAGHFITDERPAETLVHLQAWLARPTD